MGVLALMASATEPFGFVAAFTGNPEHAFISCTVATGKLIGRVAEINFTYKRKSGSGLVGEHGWMGKWMDGHMATRRLGPDGWVRMGETMGGWMDGYAFQECFW